MVENAKLKKMLLWTFDESATAFLLYHSLRSQAARLFALN